MLVALSWEECPAEQKSRGEGHTFLLTGLTVVSDPGEGYPCLNEDRDLGFPHIHTE